MSFSDTCGTLYGIGVGPGDPELMTIKAIKVLSRVKTVYAAASQDADYSTAFRIAGHYLQDDVRIERLNFPITSDPNTIAAAWSVHAREVLDHLRTGADAAFITLGDPLLYSTFGYLLKGIKELSPETHVEIVPGITSYHAAAAATQRILAEGSESLAIVPCHGGPDRFLDLIDHVECAVLLKPYRQFSRVRKALQEKGLAKGAILVSCLGQEGEAVTADLDEIELPPYFSLLLVRK